MFYEIEIVDGRLILFDDEGSSYECCPFANYREAKQTIREWARKYILRIGRIVSPPRRILFAANPQRERSPTMTIRFNALDFPTADEAIQHTYAGGEGVAIRFRGEPLVVLQEDAHRLEAAGVEFAYLHDYEMPDGSHRHVTVPVN